MEEAGGAPGFTGLDEVRFNSDGTCRERVSGRLSQYFNRGVWSLVSMPSPDGESHWECRRRIVERPKTSVEFFGRVLTREHIGRLVSVFTERQIGNVTSGDEGGIASKVTGGVTEGLTDKITNNITSTVNNKLTIDILKRLTNTVNNDLTGGVTIAITKQGIERVVDGGSAGGADGWSSRGVGGVAGGVPGDTGDLRRDLIGGPTVGHVGEEGG